MRATFISLILFLTSQPIFSQKEMSPFSYPNLDTLITYDVELKAETGPGYARYFVNGEQVRKIVYDSYSRFWDNIGKCTPCFLKTFDTDDKLIRESVQYTDCGVGQFREYYPNGRLKETGCFKKNDTGNWSAIAARGYCNTKVGKWIYYSPAGVVEKVEEYIDGNLVK